MINSSNLAEATPQPVTDLKCNRPQLALPSRQVHLDFHTSEHITDIGSDFDETQFQQALQSAEIDSITLFAKCHHSWSYYPTQVGRPHPHLQTDLLGRQIQACHQMGVRCPIYMTVGWSCNDAIDHPDWCVRTEDGKFSNVNVNPDASPEDVRPPVSWINLWPGGAFVAWRTLHEDYFPGIRSVLPVSGLMECNV